MSRSPCLLNEAGACYRFRCSVILKNTFAITLREPNTKNLNKILFGALQNHRGVPSLYRSQPRVHSAAEDAASQWEVILGSESNQLQCKFRKNLDIWYLPIHVQSLNLCCVFLASTVLNENVLATQLVWFFLLSESKHPEENEEKKVDRRKVVEKHLKLMKDKSISDVRLILRLRGSVGSSTEVKATSKEGRSKLV